MINFINYLIFTFISDQDTYNEFKKPIKENIINIILGIMSEYNMRLEKGLVYFH